MRVASYVAERTENDVEHNVIAFFTARGWLVRRKHVGLFYTANRQAIVIGKRGECDYYAVHPDLGYVEIEVKAPGKRPSAAQEEWMALMRHFRLRAIWVDGVEKMAEWYRREFGDQRTAEAHSAESAGDAVPHLEAPAKAMVKRGRPQALHPPTAVGAGEAREGAERGRREEAEG